MAVNKKNNYKKYKNKNSNNSKKKYNKNNNGKRNNKKNYNINKNNTYNNIGNTNGNSEKNISNKNNDNINNNVITSKNNNNYKKYKKKNNIRINNNDTDNLNAVIDDVNDKLDNNSLNEDNIDINKNVCNLDDNSKQNDNKNLNKDNSNDNESTKINDIDSTDLVDEILDDNDTIDKNLNEDNLKEKQEVKVDIDINKNNRLFKILIIVIFMIVAILMIVYFPKFKLNGKDNIVISYKDSYVEPGYSVKILDNDISDEVSINGKVLDGVVGDYQIEYYLDKFGIRFKKYRNISIVDKDKPLISVPSDTIKVCPNEEINDIEYSAVDEYDGDITDRVEKIINDNDVVLRVMDSSNNTVSKTLKIDRIDDSKPIIKLKGESIMFVNYGNKYIEPGYTVSDNCSNNLDSKVSVSGTVGREIGTYYITYSVTDDSGNKTSVKRKVIVGKKIVDNGVVNNGSIYLTFDDGPNEGTTNKILDILKEEGVKATFFVTMNGPDYLIKRMYDEGHMVALHTATHDYSYIYSSVNNYYNDLYKISDRVKRITGYDSKIIRFPGGSSNTVSRGYKRGIMTELTNLVLNDGYRYFDWNVDGMDASTSRTSSDVYYNVTANLNGNRANVVLMHDTKSITVGAIRNIIRYGKENGYSFKRIEMDTKMVRHSVNN